MDDFNELLLQKERAKSNPNPDMSSWSIGVSARLAGLHRKGLKRALSPMLAPDHMPKERLFGLFNNNMLGMNQKWVPSGCLKHGVQRKMEQS